MRLMLQILVVDKTNPKYKRRKTVAAEKIGSYMLGRRISNYNLFLVDGENLKTKVAVENYSADISELQKQVDELVVQQQQQLFVI